MADLLKDYQLRADTELTEVGLRVRAAPLAAAFPDRLPLARELKDINEHFGVEIAQATFSTVVEKHPHYGPFLKRVRGFDSRKFAESELRDIAASFEVTIVASQLPRSGRTWGDHSSEWASWARSLGFKTDVIRTLPSNDIWQNAALISSHLLSNPHPRRILITIGQGAAEFRSLLTRRLGVRANSPAPKAEQAGELDSIRLWINIAGAYSGSDAIRYWKRSLLTQVALSFELWTSGRNRSVMNQIDSKLSAFKSAPNFPAAMQVVNVVGLPLRAQIPSELILSYHALSKSMPTDGLTELYNSLAHPGLIVPIEGMSAKAESLKLEPILKRLLAVYAEDAAVRESNKKEADESASFELSDLES